MMKATDLGLPAIFDTIPSFEFSVDEAKSRDETLQPNKIYGVKSLDQLSAIAAQIYKERAVKPR